MTTDIDISPDSSTSPSSPQHPQRDAQFFGLQPEEFRSLYTSYLSLVSSSPSISTKDITASLASTLTTLYSFPAPASSRIAAVAVRTFSSPSFADFFDDTLPTPPGATTADTPSPISPSQDAFILQSDAIAFRDLTSADSHSTFELRCLLLSFLIAYRRNYHPRGWVRYDRHAIMYIAGLSAASASSKEELTSYLHSEYGLRMQVVGSNSPIPCFLFDWAFSHPDSPSNPRLYLGPYSPSTVFAAVPLLSAPPTPSTPLDL